MDAYCILDGWVAVRVAHDAWQRTSRGTGPVLKPLGADEKYRNSDQQAGTIIKKFSTVPGSRVRPYRSDDPSHPFHKGSITEPKLKNYG